MQRHPGHRYLLVGGWPCEDLSAAGPGLGLAGTRSSDFFDTIRVLGGLQQLLPHPPAYLLENTYMLWHHTAERVKTFDLPHIQSILGPAFSCNAARFGSGAYRLRMFWSNLQAAEHMQRALDQWQRPAGLLATDVLDPRRIPLAVGQRRQQASPQLSLQLQPLDCGGPAYPGILPSVQRLPR